MSIEKVYMPHNRFYVEKPLSSTTSLCHISDIQELHHIQHVMKCAIGDSIEVIDGKGFLGFGSIVEFGKERKKPYCAIQLHALEKAKKQSSQPVFMALAITKAASLEIALEKCTELGASGFYLFPSEYAEKNSFPFSIEKQERHKNIIRSALKQSGWLFEPEYHLFPSFQEAFSHIPTPHYISDIIQHTTPLTNIPDPKNQITLFIGPEKGWSKKEKDFFEETTCHLISLSHAILRAETAAIIGCHEMVNFAFSSL